ncbi:redoxin family protein [Nocardia altamirensis]|uniref:redoxin family protein n=1 Tax=Nocardia altamirensis TaxID=472158 RepID=UPI00083FF761|nr:redoxin family protein [Nocardia altamirensis]
MRAKQVADAAGVTVKALRHYEALGLIQPVRRPNGYREYSDIDARCVAEIRLLASLGLHLGEIGPFLDCLRQGYEPADHCPESLAAYQSKIDQIDLLITRLTRNRHELTRRMHVAARRGFGLDHDKYDETGISLLPQADPLPENLPIPQDDGAADHLPGMTIPALTFTTSDGVEIRLDAVCDGRWVLFIYPLTGEPGTDIPKGWNEIPGARGCSQEACGFRDNFADLHANGVQHVVALSSDDAEYQRALADRLHLPYPMVSDIELALAQALKLPTFEAGNATLYKRVTMVLRGNTIEHVFYPIFPPDTHAAEVVRWLTANPDRGTTS